MLRIHQFFQAANKQPHMVAIHQSMVHMDRYCHRFLTVFLHHFPKRYLGATVGPSETSSMRKGSEIYPRQSRKVN